MNCRELKDSLNERLGALFLEDEEKRHLQECARCREYYESLKAMEATLQDTPAASLDPNEFASMQMKLDERINRYQMRAISFYRLSLRFGTALGAFLLVAVISFWSGLDIGLKSYDETSLSMYDTYYLVYDTDIVEDEQDMDDDYIDLLLYEYTNDFGFNAGDILLEDITSDEMEYLEKQLEIGDIL